MDVRKVVSLMLIMMLVPLVLIFDSLFYLITRPACLNCGSLGEFIKSASLTVSLLGSVGYKLKS